MPSGGHRFVMPLFGGMGRKQRDCSRHIFGQFFEQFHRTVYEGIFDPGSPLADERGFRTDVLDALRELKVPNLRWPGGCFVSSYHWLEYTKRPVGSRWSNLPAKNGHEDPYGVPFWSLGNENYGFWDDLPVVNNPSPYLACMANTLVPEQRLSRTRALIDASGRHHVKIAFDEWNVRAWHTPPGSSAEMIGARDLNDINSTYTMADAVFSAVFLNSCIRNGDVVGMANLAPTVNVRGPLYVHADGLVKRTTFHVMSMYANLLGPRVLD